ncbi:MAG: DMT family transporter [Comamonadaceae bacterium]|nr:DMT family transporter [Comamonadaceae bacterium]
MPYYLLLSLAAIFWGGNYVVGRVLVAGIDPVLLSAIRWALTALLLCLLYRQRLRAQWPRTAGEWGRLALLAALGQVAFPVTLYLALQTVTSVRSAIYMAASPCIVMLLSRLWFGDRLRPAALLGFGVSALGVLFVLSQGQPARLLTHGTLTAGDGWAMMAVLSWAVYCTLLRLRPQRISSESFVALSSLLGALALLPAAWPAVQAAWASGGVPAPSLGQWLGVAYLVIFPSWLAYVFWSRGVAAVGAARADMFTHLIPLSGGLMGIVFLGEPFRPYHGVGALLILTGLALCQRAKQRGG